MRPRVFARHIDWPLARLGLLLGSRSWRATADALLVRILWVDAAQVQRAAATYLRDAATVAAGPSGVPNLEDAGVAGPPLTYEQLGTLLLR